jgi:hypothetical protein
MHSMRYPLRPLRVIDLFSLLLFKINFGINLRKVRGEIHAKYTELRFSPYALSALPSAIIACDRIAFTLLE